MIGLRKSSKLRPPVFFVFRLCYLILFLWALRFDLPGAKARGATNRDTTITARPYDDTRICDLPNLQVAVLTINRPQSLHRLLTSLTEVQYHCATVDLLIVVDKSAKTGANTEGVLELVKTYHWPHGSKTVMRRRKPAGLSTSWFELPYISSHKFLAIFEDDMQVSPFYFDFFSTLHTSGAFSGTGVTGFCLHPNDWELHNKKDCHSQSYSRYLYESPEPCNWGPIWKMEEWAKFLDWVAVTQEHGELPYIRNDTALNWNLYLDQGKDVQSSWVWKYNWLSRKVQIRYTFKTCDPSFPKEIFFAINHKEAGEHFKKKLDIDNDPNLLNFNYTFVVSSVNSKNGLRPVKFAGYRKNMKSLRG